MKNNRTQDYLKIEERLNKILRIVENLNLEKYEVGLINRDLLLYSAYRLNVLQVFFDLRLILVNHNYSDHDIWKLLAE